MVELCTAIVQRVRFQYKRVIFYYENVMFRYTTKEEITDICYQHATWNVVIVFTA